MQIRVLPPEVANRIAAGEVVERPASIVKELLENSLDAGAKRISVEIAEGGISLIRVSDDGCGIEAEDLSLAFSRHATSKLRHEADLEAINTLGFRGEALPSIAAVAEVEAISRTPDAPAAARVRLRFGEIVSQGAAAASQGTTITVRNLFQVQPARLKFLRTAAAEASQIATIVSHYALAYPEVAFSLRQDQRDTFRTDGLADRQAAAAGVYGRDVAAALIDVTAESEGWRLAALISPPALSRANRSYITIFINRRWVRSRSLTYAVEESYAGLLQSGRFPIAIIDLQLPAQEVDVNVHPAKAEVRLRNERQVFAFLQRPLRQALATTSPMGSPASVGWPVAAPGMTGAPPPGFLLRPKAASPTLPESSAPVSELPRQPVLPARLPILRPLGQAGTTYVIAEGPAGLYLLDQHAAHERILYEQFTAQRRQRAVVWQPLLAPLLLQLGPAQRALALLHEQSLQAHGFEFDDFGGELLLRSAAADLRGDDPARAFTELLDLMTRDDLPADPDGRVAASLACHAAVRAGQSLSLDEMRDLIRQLEECESPQTCPHGRPTMIHLSGDELARRFARK